MNEHLWWLVIASVIPLLLFEFCNGLVIGLDWMKRFSLARVLKDALLFVGVIVLWGIGMLTVEVTMALWVVTIAVAAVLLAGSAWWRVGWKITVSLRLLKRVAFFIFQAHVANVFSFLKLRSDMFIIAYFLTLDEVGYYSVSMAMIAGLWYLPASIAQVLTPHISWRSNQAGDQLTPRLTRIGFAISILASILMALLAYPLILGMFGEAFMPAYPAVLLLLPGAVVYTLAKMLAGDLIGRGLPKYAMYISIVAFIANITANLILIPRFGIVGAAIASSITHAFTGVMFLWAFLCESKVSALDALLLKKCDIEDMIKAMRRG